MRIYKICDGNEACALAAYNFTEVCGIYPITPASPMATLTDIYSSESKTNIFDEKVHVEEMQSEAGAAALVHGSLQAGLLSTTFTASQGLLLMIPSMYKIAGELLPGVIHVASRSLSTHALSIFGDHQDIYATRQSGFALLSSSSVQEAYDLALVSHLSAIKGRIPFLHFFDGFRTSHEINKINILEKNDLKGLINQKALLSFRNNAFNIGKNITRGTSQTADIYFQNTESRNKYYDALPDIVNEYMSKINKLQKTEYKPFNYYGHKEATHVIIAMGSVCDTIKLVVDALNKKGERVGVITVHLYRPWSSKYLLNVLPSTTQKVTVLDRTKEAGSEAEPLYLDVVSALKDKSTKVLGGRYGLSSKDTTPLMIASVFENMKKYNSKDHFTVGIEDDVTNTNIDLVDSFDLKTNFKEIKIFGFGSDGSVGASKNLLKVIGEKDYVQGYFEYDSRKSGGVTVSHLRISPKKINAPYLIENPNLVVVTKDSYLSKYEVLEGIKEKGVLLVNTSLDGEGLDRMIKNSTKEIIKEKHVRVLFTDASLLASTYNLHGKINNIMTYYILEMLGRSEEEIINFKEKVKLTYKEKGRKVVEDNIKAINAADKSLRELQIDKLRLIEEKEVKESIYDIIASRRGNNLKVSDFNNMEDGTFKGGNTFNKGISSEAPCWNKDNCIECNLCAFVCPHAVIKPLSVIEEELMSSPLHKEDTIASIGEEGKGFYLSINKDACTSCGLCTKVCPGKNGKKALTMEEKKDNDIFIHFKEKENNVPFDKYTIKGLEFLKHYFEYPGACAGCGETPYLRVLTSLFGESIVIANATGCSSIYGASLPSTPYTIPWINSLFEDNAEFGLGIHLAYKNARNNIKDIMVRTKDEVAPKVKSIYKKWIDNMNDTTITREVKEKLSSEIIPSELKDYLDYIPSRTVWIVGGDGWAYDIGFGGLDHALRTGENIKVLVLDTEVYSNTGGQKSKSTRTGAIAEFASTGKLKPKKDLFQIAMNIPNCYVASISSLASPMQTIKAFKEAEEHNGPALIIAYAPCIAHQIHGGLSNSLEESKLLVESGYNILMRYDTEKLYIDSKEPDFSLYETVFEKELRYKNLEILNEKEYNNLYRTHINNAKKRYSYYKHITKKQEQ